MGLGQASNPEDRAAQRFGQTLRGMEMGKGLEDCDPGRKIQVREAHQPCQVVEFSARPPLLESMHVLLYWHPADLVYFLNRALPASRRISIHVF